MLSIRWHSQEHLQTLLWLTQIGINHCQADVTIQSRWRVRNSVFVPTYRAFEFSKIPRRLGNCFEDLHRSPLGINPICQGENFLIALRPPENDNAVMKDTDIARIILRQTLERCDSRVVIALSRALHRRLR